MSDLLLCTCVDMFFIFFLHQIRIQSRTEYANRNLKTHHIKRWGVRARALTSFALLSTPTTALQHIHKVSRPELGNKLPHNTQLAAMLKL